MNTPVTTPVAPATPPLQLLVIVTKQNGVFVKDGAPTTYYGSNSLAPYLFDGVAATPTAVSGWVKVASVPQRIAKVTKSVARTIGFELSMGFAPSERMPARIDGYSSLEDTQYEGVAECYTRITETPPDTTVEVPFQLSVIAERERFEPVRSDFPITHGLIDQLTIVDPVLLQERPCQMDAKASYDLIRAHVKANIDPRYAVITSDYDFCLTVKKLIEMAHPEAYKRTIGTGRRTKEVVDYRRTREVVVYEVSPPQQGGKPYSHYPLVRPFVGLSYEDLQDKVKSFLDALMKRINEPLCECRACGGKGVIIIGA